MFLKKVFTLLICFFVSCNLFAQTSLLFIKEMPISGHQKEMRQFLKSNGFSHNACGDFFSGVIDGKNVDVILTGKKKEVGTVGIIQKPSTDALWMEYNRFVDNLLNDRYTSRAGESHQDKGCQNQGEGEGEQDQGSSEGPQDKCPHREFCGALVDKAGGSGG